MKQGERGHKTFLPRLLYPVQEPFSSNHLFAFLSIFSVASIKIKVSKGLAVLREVVGLVPGHLGARLLMARAFYSTGQADLAHQALQVRDEINILYVIA